MHLHSIVDNGKMFSLLSPDEVVALASQPSGGRSVETVYHEIT